MGEYFDEAAESLLGRSVLEVALGVDILDGIVLVGVVGGRELKILLAEGESLLLLSEWVGKYRRLSWRVERRVDCYNSIYY